MDSFSWYSVDSDYLTYLRTIDSRVPNSDYGRIWKPFFGVILDRSSKLGDIPQFSHAHDKLVKNNQFTRVVYHNGEQKAVVRLNYMFPVPYEHLNQLDYCDIEPLCKIPSGIELNKYISLLKIEMKVLNTMDIPASASKLLEIVERYPESPIAQKCLPFSRLEEAALAYVRP